MSIELVDKIDQAQKTGRKYKKVGGLNDLFLHDEEASVSSHTTTGDEYVGLELETIIEKKQKKRFAKFIAFVIVLSVLIGVAIVYHRNKSTGNSSSNAAAPSNAKGKGSSNAGGSSGAGASDSGTPDGSDDNYVSIPNYSGNSTIKDDDDMGKNVTWRTAAPLPKFSICKPAVHFQHPSRSVHHMMDIVIVPEDDSGNEWNYTFSAMDIDEHASIVAVGLSDFSGASDYAVGMVRVFAFSCQTKSYKQLGQDLLGTADGEQFGEKVSTSKDGTVMAVSAVQQNYDGGNGFVDVYYLDENTWSKLGQRIEELADSTNCYEIGAAMDLSDNGETLAVAGVVDDTTFVTRVFDYDYSTKQWIPKGHPLSVKLPDTVFDFEFAISLSEAGDELAIVDPEVGLVKYHFDFKSDKWTKGENTQKSVFGVSSDTDFWVENVDFDDSGDIVAVEAYAYGTAAGSFQVVKIVDFGNNSLTEVFTKTIADLDVGIDIAVSNDGTVVALVASRYDTDDNLYWEYDSVGTMIIVSKKNDGVWKTLSQGNGTEQVGVPGGDVALSSDGTIAAVGTDSKIAMFVISATTKDGDQTPAADLTIDDSAAIASNISAANATFFKVCAPFPTSSTSHVGDIDSLPKQEDEHSLEIALSGNGSFVAVGIDSWDDEDRGMVRVFAWDCANGTYAKWGQDLFGARHLDAFGQSVDLSSDGKVLVVGASQPPPGRTGYVDIYTFGNDGLWALDERFEEVHPDVEDVGRKVRISSDGSTVAIHGSIAVEGCGYLSSFIRIIEKVKGKWVSKGDDLIGSVPYDDFGSIVELAFAADGTSIGVTGSYNQFMAKMYTFDTKKSNWTETIVPPIKEADGNNDFDSDCEEYFDGSDISLSDDGQSVAISGLAISTSSPIVRLLKLESSGSWTMSHDPIEYDGDYSASSIGLSGDARTLAVGITVPGDEEFAQGAMFVSLADASDGGWKSLGKVIGRKKKDLLGSRVDVSSDGRLAAASSRKGYISFFKVSDAKA
jgi:hypothetical protein